MLVSARSPLAVAAAAILAAGVVVASPGLAPSSAPRIVSTPVAPVAGATAEINIKFYTKAVADLFDAAHSYTYISNVSGPSVSHPVGLIPQLIGDALNPPILGAVVAQVRTNECPCIIKYLAATISDWAAALTYSSAAATVVGQYAGVAIHDTVTPSQWGGGKVLNDWALAAAVGEAMTIGVGATVDDKWVPSIRVALISTRNQIANDILGTQTHPNYARDYTPLDWDQGGVVSITMTAYPTNAASHTLTNVDLKNRDIGTATLNNAQPAASGRTRSAASTRTSAHPAAASTAKPAAK
jgi:hypothetical protein